MDKIDLPSRFCWTRFGTESGESICSILERKEQERLANAGVFLWGIGNSVAPAIQELIRLEKSPKVIFSPMKSKPQAIDVAPSRVLRWNAAIDLNGDEWPIPSGVNVLSRGASEAGRVKRSHYALVCHSAAPLTGPKPKGEVVYDDLVNLLSQSKLGHSQVTAVVSHQLGRSMARDKSYPLGLVAALVYPYFVRLVDPIAFEEIQPNKDRPSSRRGSSQSFPLVA